MREQEQRTHRILESITDAFCTFDRDWRFTYVNRQAEVLLGRSRDDLIGKNHWEEYPDTLGTDVERNYRRAVAENVTVTFEFFYPPHDRWYEIHAYPSPDGLSVYFRDVSERKRAEIAVRESEQRFRQLADAMPQIVWTARPDGNDRLPEPPLDGVHWAAGDGGQRRLGAAPSPRRRAARRRALGGFRRERRAVRDGDPAAGSAAADLPLAPHPDRGRPRRVR